ncbi:cation:proton antiporter [Pyrococcus abyssi]|uniref:Na+/H+ antiporter n=1 Tax=Pyrococcus abyssi (strain GE5 / Orsay) TaxID=272844 RepID=Q9V2E0_PYRAB|nr:cation:proton antiporter [Pyrococcus abyssi]CAB49058.1 napA-1 Na+/H+ antiporter [Pyrococcus abyssi GE5]CCE69510.1 TPA: Na+/H+ antiporter [Pyrococcus abyssi GE5]
METLLMLALMLAVAKLSGWVFERFNQPIVLGQIIAGVIMGLLIERNEIIVEFANLGVLMLLFLAGLESDFEEFKRVGRPSILVASVGVLFAFLFGFLIAYPFFDFGTALLYGAIMTPTSVSITVKVLMELGKLRTKEGATILAAAVVDDVLGILILTIVISMLREGSVHYDVIVEVLLEVAGFLAVFLYLGPVVMENVFRRLSKVDLPESTTSFAIVFLVLFAYLAEHLNLASILGAYLIGLSIGQTSYKKRIEGPMNVIGYSIFIPVFFVEVGMRIDPRFLFEAKTFAFLYAVFAMISKVIGCGLGAYLSKFDWRTSIKIGIGMIPRLGVELAMISTAMAAGVAGSDVLTVAMTMVFLTTLITPIMLRKTYIIT